MSAPLQQGRRDPGDTAIRRVPGPALEALLGTALRRIVPTSAADPLSVPVRIEVHAEALHLVLPASLLSSARSRLEPDEVVEADTDEPSQVCIMLPVRMRLRGGQTWVVGAVKPTTRRDPTLIKALRAAHAMIGIGADGQPTLGAAPASPYLRRLVRLAFLAPDLQRAILGGRQPPGLTLESLMRAPIPMLWSEQHAMIATLGIDGASPSSVRGG